jgi:hypothetical protein
VLDLPFTHSSLLIWRARSRVIRQPRFSALPPALNVIQKKLEIVFLTIQLMETPHEI